MAKNLLNTENGSESVTISQEVNNSNLYLDEKDSKGIPLLKKVEKYPDLPEDEFIHIEYSHNGISVPDRYLINKKGQIKNKDINFILNPVKKNEYLYTNIRIGERRLSTSIHRLVAFTFLVNPDISIYSNVNHIDHNPENNSLSNLEWVTPARNSDEKNGIRSKGNRILSTYIAEDEAGKEIYRVNRETAKDFNLNIETIIACVYNGKNYRGYKWRVENNKDIKRLDFESTVGFSGNLNDYNWEPVRGYKNLFVCREGFFKTSSSKSIIGTINKDGYVWINVMDDSSEKWRHNMLAHRLMIEHYYGIKLDSKKDIIDHINTNKCDNNLDNLRVTTSKGNMQNPNTLDKFIKRRLVLTNLYGDFISYDYCKNLCKIIYSGNNYFNGNSTAHGLLRNTFSNKNFICIEQEDSERLFSILEKVIYVFDRNMNLIDAFSSSRDIEYFYSDHNIKYYQVIRSIKSGDIAEDGFYYKRGKDVVNLIISLGHGTALKFNSNLSKKDIESIKGEIIVRNIKLNYNPLEYSGKKIKEFDLSGNFIREFDSKEEANDFYNKSLNINKVISGIYLQQNNRLWCNSGEEDIIKERTDYIFYKFDKDRSIVDSNSRGYSKLCTVAQSIVKKYLNTGIPAPDGYYYQQGDPKNMIYDPENKDLIKKREIIKWKPNK